MMEYELPTELLVKVLQSLELRELLRCRMVRPLPPFLSPSVRPLTHTPRKTRARQVQKRLRDIIDSTPTLQYAIELAVSGFVDNTSNPLPLTDKLELLQAVQGAWKRARFSLGRGMPYEHDWAYAGNVLHREFEFVSLDVRAAREREREGEGRSIEARRWIIDPGLPDYFFLLDSAVDPAQDVAVFLGYDESVFACVLNMCTLVCVCADTGMKVVNHEAVDGDVAAWSTATYRAPAADGGHPG